MVIMSFITKHHVFKKLYKEYLTKIILDRASNFSDFQQFLLVVKQNSIMIPIALFEE